MGSGHGGRRCDGSIVSVRRRGGWDICVGETDAGEVGEAGGNGVWGGEAGVVEELEAGEAGGGGVFGLGEGAEALDDQGLVGLREEAGLFL